MSKWNDRKKKDDEQNAQIEKPEESAVKDYSAGAIGKAYANTERPAMKTAQTPSFDEPSLTGVYGLQKNSKGESVMDTTGKTSAFSSISRITVLMRAISFLTALIRIGLSS